MRCAALALAMLLAGTQANAQSRTVFKGSPFVKISEAGSSRVVDSLSRPRAENLSAVVSEISGTYYWASRENKELIRHESGAFITYAATDGSGYIRLIDPLFKDAAALIGDSEAKYDYVEHLLIGLGSVTYYGVADAF